MTPRTLLAIDGNSLAHRAFHAYERQGLRNSKGHPVYATYGFFALLSGILDKARPDALVVGFDDHTSSERKARCPQYKAQRSEKSEELYVQMADIGRLLGELGVPVIVPAGLEADDVLGSAAATAQAAGWRCVIATSDRDSFGLITDSTLVLRLVSGLDNAEWFNPDALFAKYGVYPHQYLDYAAMRGDSSDNLPGVLGIGEKTAAKLLQATGTLQAALDDPAVAVAAVGKTYAAKLTTDAARENLARNLDIMTILRDVPVDLDKAILGTDAQVTEQVLHAWELKSLTGRLKVALNPALRSQPAAAWQGPEPDTRREEPAPAAAVSSAARIGMWVPVPRRWPVTAL
jgi:5'-3' exonuclease